MLRIEGDRRRYPRIELQRPCKVFDPSTGKYHAGQTRDLSNGGILLEIPRLLELKPGDRVHVGVAMTRRHAILQAKEMIEAIVVRSLATQDDCTHLAVKFDHPQAGVDAVHIDEHRHAYRAAA
jgi:hypothetical protein